MLSKYNGFRYKIWLIHKKGRLLSMNRTNCIIILNYNDWKSCVKLADMIMDYDSITNIIIVDNLSQDDSIDRLKKTFATNSKITIVESDKNGGYAYGNHIGCLYAIQKFNAYYITIANPDIHFTEETMKNMLKVLTQNPNAGIVGCMMKYHSNIDLPSAWKIPRYMDCILENLIILQKIIGDRTRYDDYFFKKKLIKVDALPGSFFLLRSDTYKAIGGFDINTFLYYEENILAKKIKENGYQNYLLTDYSYDHIHSVTIDKSYKTIKSKLDLVYKSREYYVQRYLGCNKIQIFVLKLTYLLGRTDYLFVKKIYDIIKFLLYEIKRFRHLL